MKKILLATAALAISATAVHAQAVRIGGEGRMGLIWTRTAAIPGTGTAAQITTTRAALNAATANYLAARANLAAAQAALTANPTDDNAAAVLIAERLVATREAAVIGLTGVLNTQVGTPSSSGWAQENRLQFNFAVSVEADHGLSFGAFTRARMNNGSAASFSGSRVWVEANNLRLTFGNQDGAFRGAGAAYGYLGGCAIGYVGGILCGDTAGLLGRTQGFDSNFGGPVSRARVDYSFADTRVALSYDRSGSTELGVRSSFDAITVALGYSNRANAAGAAGNTVALSAHYNGGTWGVGALVARLTTGTGVTRTRATNWSITGNVEVGGGNLLAYVGRVDNGLANVSNNTWGLNYAYGLGGGATLSAGIERAARTTSAAVGVAFNF